MAWTAAQKAAIERANQRLSEGGSWSDEQKAAIERAQERAGKKYVDEHGNTYYDTPVDTGAVNDSSSFSRGFGAGIDSLQGLGYGLVGLAGQAVGADSVRDWGVQGYLDNMAEIQKNSKASDSYEGVNSLGDAASFAGYWAGYAVPQAIGALASGGIGSMVGKQVAKQGVKALIKSGAEAEAKNLLAKAATRGSLGGVAAQAFGTELGATYGGAVDRARENGTSIDDINLGRVVAGGLAAGALEFGADVATLGLAKLGPGKKMFDAMKSTRRSVNVPVMALGGAVTEGLTEVAQTGIEEMGAGASFGEANFSDPTSFFAGAVGGGMMGGIGGLRRPTPSETKLDDTAADARARAQAQQELAARAQEEAALRQRGIDRLAAAPTFVSQKDFAKVRDAERASLLDDPKSELSGQYTQWLLDNEILPVNKQEQDKAKKDFLKQTQDSPEIVRQAYLDALDGHIESQKAHAARTPEVQAKVSEQTGKLIAVRANAIKAKNANVLRQVEEAAVNMLTPGEWAAAKYKADGLIKPEGAPKPATTGAQLPVGGAVGTTTAETPAPDAPKPETGKVAQMRAYAVEKLGENWEVDHPGLSQDFGNRKGFYPKKKGATPRFMAQVDKAVAEAAAPKDAQTEAPKTEQETQSIVANRTPTVLADLEAQGLSKNQAAVYAVLQDAIAGNSGVEVLDANGGLNLAAIAEKADISGKNSNARRNAVQTAIKQLRPKIAKAYGVPEAEVGPALAKLAAKNRTAEEAVAPDAPVAKLDVKELDVNTGGAMNTVESAGQGAYRGVTKEDKAYTKAQSEKVDPVYEKRKQEADGTRKAIVADTIKRYGSTAVRKWKELSAVGDVAFEDLSTASKIDWVMAVAEEGDGYSTVEQLSDDQREIARGYDASNAGVTMEELDAGRTQSADGKPSGESRSRDEAGPGGAAAAGPGDSGRAGRTTERSGTGNAAEGMASGSRSGSTPGRFAGAVEDAEVVSETAPTEGMSDGQDAGKPTTRDERNAKNVASFKESYAAKDGYNSAMWENPDLAETAAYADWLGAFSDAQWAKITPIFDNSKNPFKNPVGLDVEAAKAAIVEALRSGEATKKPVVEVKKRKKITKFGVVSDSDAPGETATRESMSAAVTNLLGRGQDRRIHIYETEQEALADLEEDGAVGEADKLRGKGAFGWVSEADNGETHAHFILENIPAGYERAAFMHEVGGHVGWDGIIDDDTTEVIVAKIGRWAAKDDDSVESRIATRAMARVEAARIGGAVADEAYSSEVVAYFLEEATNEGLEPTVKTAVGRLLRDLYAAFKRALHRLNLLSHDFSAQDMVDIAWGAARMDLGARFHTSGVGFRRFDSRYMGSGAGAQTYGFGHYIADRLETTLIYPSKEAQGVTMKVDTTVDDSELMHWMGPVRRNQKLMELLDNLPEDLRDALEGQLKSGDFSDFTGRQIYLALAGTQLNDSVLEQYVSEEAYNYAQSLPQGAQAAMAMASSYLDANGVKGIIYADAQSHRGLGPRTYNRVIFNEDNVIVVGRAPKSAALNGEPKALREMRFGVLGETVEKKFGKTTKQAFDDSASLAKKAANSTKFLHQIIHEVRKTMPAAKTWYEAMMKRDSARNSTVQLVESIAVRARKLDGERMNTVNKFLADSTVQQKWGYDPKFPNRKIVVDPAMKARFDALSAGEQQLVKDVFLHGENMRVRKVEIARNAGVKDDFFSAAALTGPYAPLKRFGNYATVMKSSALLKAEADVAQNPNAANTKKAEKLYSDGRHYVVKFFDTMGQAKRWASENGSGFEQVVSSERRPDIYQDRVSNTDMLERVLASVKADSKSGLDGAAKKAVGDMVRTLYFEQMDERDSRLSGARRRSVAGFEENMIRSFLSHARSEAGLIASMEHGAEINEAFMDMKKQARGNEELESTYVLLAKHYQHALDTKGTRWNAVQDRLAAANSFYMLTSSPGYHITNLTQPGMVTVPRLAGDFGGYASAWSALFRGYKVAKAATQMRKLETDIDLTRAGVPVKYRALLEKMQVLKLLDVGMDEDVGSFDRFQTGFEMVDNVSDKAGTVIHKGYQVSRLVEAYNRIATAVAAYDLALENKDKLKALDLTAEEYATLIVQDTQGNFAGSDAPLAIKNINKYTKLTTQYRKYQMLMAWNYANATKQMFKGETAEVRWMGARTLAYSLAHAGIFGGVTGIPLLTTVAPWFLAFFNDGDEPEDLERSMRDWFGDDVGGLLSRGVFSMVGIDMSTKLSQADIFDPLPYVDVELSQDATKDMFFGALAGPSGTTAMNFARAAEYFKQGDMLKGIEYSMPKGIRSAVESYRLGSEGYTTSNGTVIADPRNFDGWSLLVNAMGIPATEINTVKWTRGQQYELEQWFGKESGRIRQDYIKASKARDTAAKRAATEAWRELQQAKDRVRPFFNNATSALQRQSVTDLMRAPSERSKLETSYSQKMGAK